MTGISETITYGTLHASGSERTELTLDEAREAVTNDERKGYITQVVRYVNGEMDDQWEDEPPTWTSSSRQAQEKTERPLQIGDRVRITGIVKRHGPQWGRIAYQDAGVPGFYGYAWTKPVEESTTFHPRTEGVIVGKRRFRSMTMDEGIWVPDTIQEFTAYLVAWDISRNPAIVRIDQMERINP